MAYSYIIQDAEQFVEAHEKTHKYIIKNIVSYNIILISVNDDFCLQLKVIFECCRIPFEQRGSIYGGSSQETPQAGCQIAFKSLCDLGHLIRAYTLYTNVLSNGERSPKCVCVTKRTELSVEKWDGASDSQPCPRFRFCDSKRKVNYDDRLLRYYFSRAASTSQDTLTFMTFTYWITFQNVK